METAATESLEQVGLRRLLPTDPIRRLFFWVLLPFVLLALNVSLVFLRPCLFTAYFPFVTLASILVTVRWRTSGIAIAYCLLAAFLLFFYSSISVADRLWQMGAIFCLATNVFISLLAFEEIEGLFHGFVASRKQNTAALLKTQQELKEKETDWESAKEQMRAEIERLKTEAEQRRIDREQDQQTLALVTSEIELLTSQKEMILNQARENYVPQQIDPVQLADEEADQAREFSETTSLDVEESTRQLARAEGLYRQLREQFDEKTKILSQTRQELFRTVGKLEALEVENHLNAFEPEEILYLEKALATLEHEQREMESELTSLEGLISHILSQ